MVLCEDLLCPFKDDSFEFSLWHYACVAVVTLTHTDTQWKTTQPQWCKEYGLPWWPLVFIHIRDWLVDATSVWLFAWTASHIGQSVPLRQWSHMFNLIYGAMYLCLAIFAPHAQRRQCFGRSVQGSSFHHEIVILPWHTLCCFERKGKQVTWLAVAYASCYKPTDNVFPISVVQLHPEI